MIRPHSGRRKRQISREQIERLQAAHVSAGERRRISTVPLALNFYCQPCRSWRVGETCPKCGGETILYEDA